MDPHDEDGLVSAPDGGEGSEDVDASAAAGDGASAERSYAQRQERVRITLTEFWRDQLRQVQAAGTDIQEFKNHPLPLARIKKIMKSDEDVRMISSEAPILFAKACELFILELTHRSWAHSEEAKRRTLQRNDIAAAIGDHDVFDFLFDVVPREEIGEGVACGELISPPAPSAPLASSSGTSATPELPPMPTTSIQPAPGMYAYSSTPGAQLHGPYIVSSAQSSGAPSSQPYMQYMSWPQMQQGIQPSMGMMPVDPMQVHVAQQMQAAQQQYMQRQQQMAKQQGSVRLPPHSGAPPTSDAS